MGAQGLDLDDLLGPFGRPFSSKFHDRPNLLNCNTHDAKTLLYNFRPFILALKNPLKFMFFQGAIQDQFFSHFICFYVQP